MMQSTDAPSHAVPSSGNGARAVIALTPTERSAFFPGAAEARLRALLPHAKWCDPAKTAAVEWHETVSQRQPEILVSGWRTPRLPTVLPRLKYVCHVMGSVRGLIPRELMAAGLIATNWGGIAAPMVAEHALLLMLGALRSMPRWPYVMNSGFSQDDRDALGVRTLIGCRVSLHGFGKIARFLAKLLGPFNVDLMAYSEGVPADFMLGLGVRPADNLRQLAERADVFVSCEALTEKTRKSIGTETLFALPRGSVFVNVGRGAVVDEDALTAVALERHLRVASDVYTTEPLPRDAAIRGISGALFSPHIGGPTVDRYPVCGEMAMNNIERYLNGQPLENAVTLELYDRST